MPSSPKTKHLPIVRIKIFDILVIACSVFMFMTASFWLGVVIGECSRHGENWSIHVLWQKNSKQGLEEAKHSASDDLLENVYVNLHANDVTELGDKRHKVMAFVGIMTDYDSSGRRQSLRKTWMPSDQQSLQRMEESTGLAFRFVIGKSDNKSRSQELQKELQKYDDFMMLDFQEEHTKPAYKTYLFLKAAYAFFDCDFYVKVQDDIYLRPDRLSLLLAKDRPHTQTYLGCMTRILLSDLQPWLEKQLTGSGNFLHAQKSFFALSADIVDNLMALRHSRLRMFHSEDVTIGAWMLAMNVHYENNQLLCETYCSSRSIIVTDFPRCSGLCDAEERLLELHEEHMCSKSPIYPENMVLKFLEWGKLLQNKSRKQQAKSQNRRAAIL